MIVAAWLVIANYILRTKTSKSHPRKWVEGSSPTYNEATMELSNPTNGSGGHPTAVGGICIFVQSRARCTTNEEGEEPIGPSPSVMVQALLVTVALQR